MSKTKGKVSPAIAGRGDWIDKLLANFNPRPFRTIHLVVLKGPYLSLILSGNKTFESRFSKTRRAPYEAIERGDLHLLKQVCGPVVGTCLAGQVRFFKLDEGQISRLSRKYSVALCVDEKFWRRQRNARYATLVELLKVLPIDPVPCFKCDQRAWVVLWRHRRCTRRSVCAHPGG